MAAGLDLVMLLDADAQKEPEKMKKVEFGQQCLSKNSVLDEERKVFLRPSVLSLLSFFLSLSFLFSPQKFGSCKVQLSSQSTCEKPEGKKLQRNEREEDKKEKKNHNAERENE